MTPVLAAQLRELRAQLRDKADATEYRDIVPAINACLWEAGFPPDEIPMPTMSEAEWIRAWRQK